MAPMRLFLCCALSLTQAQASFDDASVLLQTGAVPEEKSNRIQELKAEIEQRKAKIAHLKEEVAQTKSREAWIEQDKNAAIEAQVEASDAAAAPYVESTAEERLGKLFRASANAPAHPIKAPPQELRQAAMTREEKARRALETIGHDKATAELMMAGHDSMQSACPDCRQRPEEAYSLKPIEEVFAPTVDPLVAQKMHNQQIKARADAWQYQQQLQVQVAAKQQQEAREAARQQKAASDAWYAEAARQQKAQAKVQAAHGHQSQMLKESRNTREQSEREDARFKQEMQSIRDSWKEDAAKDEAEKRATEEEAMSPYLSGDAD